MQELLALDAVWSMYEPAFHGLSRRLAGLTPQAGYTAAGAGGRAYAVGADGVAMIDINGPLTKNASWIQQYIGGTSYAPTRAAVRAAAADPGVKAICYVIDSPGGATGGVGDLADDIEAAARLKPSCAYIEDMGASAAYWLASAAGKVYCNPTALVGSIGTYMVLADMSQMAANAGVKVHVIKAGDFKGAGVPGSTITDEQLADMQRVVESLNSSFVAAVAKGRGMSAAEAAKVADGRVHVGAAAKALGLVDGVQSLDATRAGLLQRARPTAGERSEIHRSEIHPLARAELDRQALAAANPAPAVIPAPVTHPAPSRAQGVSMSEAISKPPAPLTGEAARHEFERRVSAKIAATGWRRERAASAVYAADPDLQAALRGREPTAAAAGADDPITEVDRRVAQLKCAGMDHARAVGRVFFADPALHARYKQAYADRHLARAGGR